MNLKKIAQKANVSVSTVSRALNNSYDVSPETRELILKIATESGYFREKKKVRQENKRHDSVNIAIICPEIISSHYSYLVTECADVIRKRGSDCTVYYNEFNKEKLLSILNNCINDTRFDAVICFTEIKEKIESGSIPIICTKGADCYSKLFYDYNKVLDSCAECLIKNGRKKIGFAGESHTVYKRALLNESLKNRNMPLHTFYESNLRFEQAGVECAKQFLLDKNPPDGIVCGYDEIAYGFIHTLEKNGIKVPEDVSVIGINNVPSAEFFFNGLTTVGFDCKEVFEELFKDIKDAVFSGTFTPKEYIMPLALKERGTV